MTRHLIKKGFLTVANIKVAKVSLLKEKHKCSDDDDYSFTDCIQSYILNQVGCHNPLNEWMEPNTLELSSRLPLCSKPAALKQLNGASLKVQYATYDIESVEEMTKCKRPCTYNVFSLAHSVQQIQTPNFTRVIAEFGGTLGLFVGFSFLMVWDIIDEVLTKTHAIIKIRFK